MRVGDLELLNRYGTEADQEAFAELVQRHYPAISAAARRMVVEPAAAEDVAQAVFTRLALRWRRVPRRCVLGAWLHADARFVALQWLRSERRRQLREQAATAPPEVDQAEDIDWAEIRPLLDASISHLAGPDRDVIVMKFFEQCSLKEMAERLLLSEDAARMRIHRAVEKLREQFRRQGVVTTSAALSATLTAHAVYPLPASLVQTVASLAITTSQSAQAAAASTHLLSTLLMNKAIPLAAAVLTVVVIVQRTTHSRLEAEYLHLQGRVQDLQQEQATWESSREQAVAAAERERVYLAELTSLRAEIGSRRAVSSGTLPGAAPTAHAVDSVAPGESPVEFQPLTDAEVAKFLLLPEKDQGKRMGAQRFPAGFLQPLSGDPVRQEKEYAKARELGGRIRQGLDALEDAPAKFADFQSAFIQSVTGLTDAGRLEQIRSLIESTYQQAVRDGLTVSRVPQEGIEEWGRRRDALDRWATHEVQGLLDDVERSRFDRALIGVMGIDLGLGDGRWYRFSGKDGSIVFPSQGGGVAVPTEPTPPSP